MTRVRFSKPRPDLDVAPGANLMRALQEADIPVASSCGGDGVCAKCRLRILEGAENLSPESELERDLRERHGLEEDERISCQAQVLGDIRIDASYW